MIKSVRIYTIMYVLLLRSIASAELAALLGMGGKEFLAFFLAVDAAEEFLQLNLALQLHQAVEEGLRSRRTSGDIDVDRKNLVDSRHHAIAILNGPPETAQPPQAITYLGSASCS